jgi:ArsR family transcriptional regulator, zinc-responsive transcriptional repressor
MKCSTNDTCHLFFSTLANPTRIAILETLQVGPKNVAELAKLLGHERSMISHNLKPLEDCMFVYSERKGKTRVYRLNKEIIDPLFELFNFHASKYCPNGRVCLTKNGYDKYRKKQAEEPLYLNQK